MSVLWSQLNAACEVISLIYYDPGKAESLIHIHVHVYKFIWICFKEWVLTPGFCLILMHWFGYCLYTCIYLCKNRSWEKQEKIINMHEMPSKCLLIHIVCVKFCRLACITLLATMHESASDLLTLCTIYMYMWVNSYFDVTTVNMPVAPLMVAC